MEIKTFTFVTHKADTIRLFKPYYLRRYSFLLLLSAIAAIFGGLMFIPGFASQDPDPASSISLFVGAGVFLSLYVIFYFRGVSTMKRSLIGSPESATVTISSANGLTISTDGRKVFEHLVGGEGGFFVSKNKTHYFLRIRRLYFFPIPRQEETKAVLLEAGVAAKDL